MVYRDMLFRTHALQMYDKIMVLMLCALHRICMLAGAFQSAAFVMQDITSQVVLFHGLLKAIVL